MISCAKLSIVRAVWVVLCGCPMSLIFDANAYFYPLFGLYFSFQQLATLIGRVAAIIFQSLVIYYRKGNHVPPTEEINQF